MPHTVELNRDRQLFPADSASVNRESSVSSYFNTGSLKISSRSLIGQGELIVVPVRERKDAIASTRPAFSAAPPPSQSHKTSATTLAILRRVIQQKERGGRHVVRDIAECHSPPFQTGPKFGDSFFGS